MFSYKSPLLPGFDLFAGFTQPKSNEWITHNDNQQNNQKSKDTEVLKELVYPTRIISYTTDVTQKNNKNICMIGKFFVNLLKEQILIK